MKWQPKLLMALPLIVFLMMSFFLFKGLGQDPQYMPSAKVGKPMPTFTKTSLHDSARTLTNQDLHGHPYLLNVWATWCPSCLVEHPALLQLAQSGVRLIGLNYKDNRQAARQYLKLKGDPFVETLFDPEGMLGLDLGVYGAPETFIVDAQGHIQHRFVGVITQEVWETELKPIYDILPRSSPGNTSIEPPS